MKVKDKFWKKLNETKGPPTFCLRVQRDRGKRRRALRREGKMGRHGGKIEIEM